MLINNSPPVINLQQNCYKRRSIPQYIRKLFSIYIIIGPKDRHTIGLLLTNFTWPTSSLKLNVITDQSNSITNLLWSSVVIPTHELFITTVKWTILVCHAGFNVNFFVYLLYSLFIIFWTIFLWILELRDFSK